MKVAVARLIVFLSALLLLALGALILSNRPNPALGLQRLLDALEESDETALGAMSGRYRSRHELDEFRRSLARFSELRSADATRAAPPLPFLDQSDDVFFCTTLVDIERRLKVRVVWEGPIWGGAWRVDGLAMGPVQFDYEQPLHERCPVTH